MSFTPENRRRPSLHRWGILLLLLLVACRPAPEVPETDGPILIGATSDIEGLNDLLALGGSLNLDIIRRLFLSLLEEQPDFQEHPPTFRPRLAESFDWSPDHKVLTFRLRDDVVWSDGVPVTAEDVRWTWEAQRDPDVAWDYSFAKEKIWDVEVVDAHTVRFHFSEVYSTQMTDANEGVILPKHAWSKLPFDQWRQNPRWFIDNLVVSGPFYVESWKPQQEIVLRRNEKYFEPGLPRAETVIFRVVPDIANLFQQLLAGGIDMVDFVQPAQAARVQESEDVELVTFASRRYHFISWNTERPWFKEPEVRVALTLAIDRQTIIDSIWLGYAQLATSPILSTIWAHNHDLTPWPYDPDRARLMLEQHGWIDRDGDGIRERDGVRFAFEMTTNPGDQTRIDAIVMIQDQLRRVGVEVQLGQVEFNTLNARNQAHDYDATFGAFSVDTSLDLSYAFATGARHNYGRYSNPEVDGLLQEIRRQTDIRAALPMLHRIQEILHEEQPLTFLWEPRRLVGIRKRVWGARPNALSDYFNLREWSLVPPPADG